MTTFVSKIKGIFQQIHKESTAAYPFYLGLRFLVSIIVSVLIVKSGVAKSQIGNYEWIMFMTMACSMFWSSGIASATTSFFQKSTQSQQLFRSAFWMTSVASMIVSVSILLYLTGSDSTGFEQRWYYTLSAILILFSGSLPLVESYFLVKNEAASLTKYGLWSQGSLLILLGLVIFFTRDIGSIIGAIIIHSLLRWIYLVNVVLDRKIGPVDWPSIRKFGYYALPICLTLLLGTMMDTIDGLLVRHYFDLEQFAIYRYGGRELPFVSLVFVGISTALIPQMINGDQTLDVAMLKKQATKWMHVFMPLAIMLMILSPWLFKVVYSEAFVASAYIFNTYLLIMVSRVLLPQTALQSIHANDVILWSSVIEVMANIVLSVLFVKKWGMLGLAFGTVIAYLSQKVIMIIMLYRMRSISIGDLIDLKWYTIYSLALMGIYYIIYTQSFAALW